MEYLLCFESYLEGSRAPIYTWVRFSQLMETDEINVGTPGMDRHGKRRYHKKQVKSISLTRSANFVYGSTRLVLDMDRLRNDGYVSIPFDEFGHAVSRSGKMKTSKSTHFKYLKSVIHGLDKYDHKPRVFDVEEFEERIYKDINNIGKYIIYIDVDSESTVKLYNKELIKYIKKYPHIKVRLRDKHIKVFKGRDLTNKKEYPTQDGTVIFGIENIREIEKEKALSSNGVFSK